MKGGRIILRLLVFALKVLWYSLVGIFYLVGKIFYLIRFGTRVPKALTSTIVCPAGHEGSAVGSWRCTSCGGEFEGWVWQGCPVCGSVPLYVTCERCNLAIRNPFLD